MKTLTSIRLINWHHFENANINVNGTTYFIGINGAGKSTVLDAVQFALIGGQRDVKFNQAAVAGGKRTLASYVRGELGTEGQLFMRGDATGVVALEFKNEDGSSFVHGAVIDAFEDGRSPDVMYFIVHNAKLNDDWFFDNNSTSKTAPAKNSARKELTHTRLYDTREFKRHLDQFKLPLNAKAQLFARVEDYRVHLLNRLGQLRDNFPAKLTKGLAFTPLTDIRAFVHSFLLDEHLVDVKTLQAQLDTLRHFEGLAADVRERIAALTEIANLDEERLANRRRRITNGFVRRRVEAEAHATELKRCRVALEETKLNLSRAELRRDDISEQLKRAENGLLDAKVALQSDLTAIREKELRDKIGLANAELSQLRQVETRLNGALQTEHANLLRLKSQVPQQAQTFIPFLTLHPETPIQNIQAKVQHIQTLIPFLQQLGNDFARDEALLNEQARLLRDEATRLSNEIRQLKTGDRETSFETEAPEAARLRRLLRAELGLGADDVLFLCSVLNVPDEGWQDAIEGVLGQSRFTLLVPPKHYSAAMHVYRKLRHEQHLHGAGVLDAEKIVQAHSARNNGANQTALADEITTTHPAARAFVDLILGGYVKCDTLDALRPHRTAVTRECFVRRNFSTSHLNPRVYKRWFIGERALPRQIEQRETRLQEIANELATLQTRINLVREQLGLTRDRVRNWIDIERDMGWVERLPALISQFEQLTAELKKLDVRNLGELRSEVQHCQRAYDQVKTQSDEVLMQIGQLKTQASTLADERIVALEHAVESAQQNTLEYLSKETATDMHEAVHEEYERRCDRQPLEKILENSTRYETEHQSAEMRSRDKLREAKQTYTLRYDFGGDNDEDAARYATERERFVQSELPAYEAQIAKQRGLAEQELVENFIHRLAEQIQDARQQLGHLNDTLKDLRFGGERFEFVAHTAVALKPIYEMLMDSELVLGDSLFETGFRQKHQQAWDLLFEQLTRNDEANTELRALQDYRNYLEYDIRIHYPNGDRALLSKINAKKSGGETTTPFYVAMAASFAQAYRLNQARGGDTIRIAMFDEAFSKMDTARTASALQFMRDIGLQVLLATPPDKSGALLRHVDSVRTVVKKDNRSFVIEMDRAEMIKKLEDN